MYKYQMYNRSNFFFVRTSVRKQYVILYDVKLSCPALRYWRINELLVNEIYTTLHILSLCDTRNTYESL